MFVCRKYVHYKIFEAQSCMAAVEVIFLDAVKHLFSYDRISHSPVGAFLKLR